MSTFRSRYGEGPLHSYSVVEQALMDVFDLPKTSLLALRARIRNLQRLGLTPSTPGSGKRVQYSFSDIYDLAFALSLAEFGLDPRKILRQVRPGQIAGLPKDRYCVFKPENFSKGTSVINFVNAPSVLKMAVLSNRLAVINVDDLRFRVGAHTRELQE